MRISLKNLHPAMAREYKVHTCDTGGSRGSGLYHAVASVALEHDLTTVLDLPDVGPAGTPRYQQTSKQNRVSPLTGIRRVPYSL